MNKKVKKVASMTVIASLLMSQMAVAAPKKVHLTREGKNYSFNYTMIATNTKLLEFFKIALREALESKKVPIYIEDDINNKTVELAIGKPYYEYVVEAQDVSNNVPKTDVIVTVGENGEVVEEVVGNPDVEVDKSVLISAIEAANTNKDSVITSGYGLGVSTKEEWVTPEVKATYQTAIDNASEVNDKTDATQPEVNTAIEVLANATTTFDLAKRYGLGDIVGVDKGALVSAIDNANNNIGPVKESTDGKDIEKGKYWATKEVLNNYKDAIKEADEVYKDESATEENVAEAVTKLGVATTTFDGLKELSKKEEVVVPVDKTTLAKDIIAAEENKSNVITGEKAEDVEYGKEWVTAVGIKAYEDAIKEANKVSIDENATQEQVDEAIKALATATDIFDNLKEDGTKEVVVTIDKSALDTAIKDAEKKLKEFSIENAGVVEANEALISKEVFSDYTLVIVNTKYIYGNLTTKEQMDKAIEALDIATSKFELGRLIYIANKSLASVTTNASEVGADKQLVSEKVFNNYNTIVASVALTYNQNSPTKDLLNSAIKMITNATNEFEAGKNSAVGENKEELLGKINAAKEELKSVEVAEQNKPFVTDYKKVIDDAGLVYIDALADADKVAGAVSSIDIATSKFGLGKLIYSAESELKAETELKDELGEFYTKYDGAIKAAIVVYGQKPTETETTEETKGAFDNASEALDLETSKFKLGKSIYEATENKDSATINISEAEIGAVVGEGKDLVSKEVFDAYVEAIRKAGEVYKGADKEKGEVDASTGEMNTATDNFNTGKTNVGVNDSADKENLLKDINAAKEKLKAFNEEQAKGVEGRSTEVLLSGTVSSDYKTAIDKAGLVYTGAEAEVEGTTGLAYAREAVTENAVKTAISDLATSTSKFDLGKAIVIAKVGEAEAEAVKETEKKLVEDTDLTTYSGAIDDAIKDYKITVASDNKTLKEIFEEATDTIELATIKFELAKPIYSATEKLKVVTSSEAADEEKVSSEVFGAYKEAITTAETDRDEVESTEDAQKISDVLEVATSKFELGKSIYMAEKAVETEEALEAANKTVSVEALSKYEAAIATAKIDYNAEFPTKAKFDSAFKTLGLTTDEFESAKEMYTSKAKLDKAIKDANDALALVTKPQHSGRTIKILISETVFDAYEGAIKAATTVYNTEASTKTQVEDATKKLEGLETSKFKLGKAIDMAIADKDLVEKRDYKNTDKDGKIWVTAEEHKAYEDAIAVATNVLNGANPTKENMDNAVVKLGVITTPATTPAAPAITATDIFATAKKVSKVDTSKLGKEYVLAIADLNSFVGVGDTPTKYVNTTTNEEVTTGVFGTYKTAIEDADKVFKDDKTNDTAVATALTTFRTAMNVFKDAKTPVPTQVK